MDDALRVKKRDQHGLALKRAALKRAYHSNTLLRLRHSFPYAVCNNSRVSLGVFFNLKQNLMAALCSIIKIVTQQKITALLYQPKLATESR